MSRRLSLLTVLLFTLLIVQVSVASPLVLKLTKEVAAGGEIVRFDTAKYKKILVGAMFVTDNIKTVEERDDRSIRILAVEGEDLFFMQSVMLFKSFPSRTISIDNLPSRLSFVAEKAGTYKIFIWAE